MFIQLLQLLHQFLQSCHKLVNCLVLARADITCDTGSDMMNELTAALTAADWIRMSLQ